MHAECSKQHSESRSSDIKNPALYVFSLVKIDAFLYTSSRHSYWTKIGKNREKIFFVFFTCGQNPYYLLYTLLYSCLWTGKNSQKFAFFGFQFFYLNGVGDQYNIENRFVWPQKTSPIAGIHIVNVWRKILQCKGFLEVIAISTFFFTVLCINVKKRQNTVFGYKKGSKSAENKTICDF